jgi:hypothetical protein
MITPGLQRFPFPSLRREAEVVSFSSRYVDKWIRTHDIGLSEIGELPRRVWCNEVDVVAGLCLPYDEFSLSDVDNGFVFS